MGDSVSFYRYDQLGRITSTGYCPQSMLELQGGDGVFVKEGTADIGTDYVDVAGYLHKKPERPTEHHIFDYNIKGWIDPRNLDEIKDIQWTLIKEERTRARDSGFTWNGYVFDSNPEARTNISDTAQLAALNPAEFSTNWTIADNSTVPLDGFQMIEVGKALGAHVLGTHTKSVALREQIYNATSKEEVESISW